MAYAQHMPQLVAARKETRNTGRVATTRQSTSSHQLHFPYNQQKKGLNEALLYICN